MKYNFDEIIDRKNTISTKWDNVGPAVGNPEALPMWVADMDFRCPQPVIDALTRRAQLGIYGYCFMIPRYQEAVKSWVERRHGWKVKIEDVMFVTGAVPGIYSAVQVFTKPGEKVLIQRPVYYPFTNAAVENGREVSSNSLIYRDGRYEIDFEDFERRAADPHTHLFVLCNPHNPVGRVYTEEELRKMSEICLRHNVVVFSDEIHSDFILSGNKHIPTASLSPEIAANTITAVSPSKTFNLAGMRASCLIISNEQLRKKMAKVINDNRSGLIPIFGMESFITAYESCEDYVDQLVPYIQKNIEFLDSWLQENTPKIKMVQPQGTYLVWLDCRELGLSDKEIDDFFIHTAGIATDRGHLFGPEGEGFQRLNLACPLITVKEATARLKRAYDALFAEKGC